MLVEDEVNPETIQFIIQDADQINDLENLVFKIQYWRSSTDCGVDNLIKTYTNGILYLNWNPTAGATLNKGTTKLQIVGYKTSGGSYTVRWSTKPTQIVLSENLVITQTTPTIQPDFLANYFGGETNGNND